MGEKIEPTGFIKEFLESARACASHIFDSVKEEESYRDHVRQGKNPMEHVFYHAALVLGKDDELDVDIQEFEERRNPGIL